METFKNIILSKNNKGISRIILNDPQTYNSLSLATINSLIEVFKLLEKDR